MKVKGTHHGFVNRSVWLIVSLLLLFLFFLIPARAEPRPWEPVLKQARELFFNGFPEEGLALGETGVAIARKGGSDTGASPGEAMTLLAELYLIHGIQEDHPEPSLSHAAAWYREALKIFEREYGQDDARLIPVWNKLAEVYIAQCRFTRAERAYHRLEAIHEKVHGAWHGETIANLNRLAELYERQHREERVAATFRKIQSLQAQAVTGVPMPEWKGPPGESFKEPSKTQSKVVLPEWLVP